MKSIIIYWINFKNENSGKYLIPADVASDLVMDLWRKGKMLLASLGEILA